MSGISLAKLDNCLVVGNGESRQGINLNQFTNNFTIIGCNALHRDMQPDYLVCCDKRMIDEAVINLKHSHTKILVRPEWFSFYRKTNKNKKILQLPNIPYPILSKQDEERNWGSGTYAALVASQTEASKIYLIGFDLYSNKKPDIGIKNGGYWYNYIKETVNNLYRDTANYAVSDSPPVDPSYWIYQISKVFSNNQNKQFIIINNEQWQMPKEWQQNNVHFISLNTFLVDNKYPSSIITT